MPPSGAAVAPSLYGYSAGTAAPTSTMSPLVSPTGLTNSIPRTRAGGSRRRGGGGSASGGSSSIPPGKATRASAGASPHPNTSNVLGNRNSNGGNPSRKAVSSSSERNGKERRNVQNPGGGGMGSAAGSTSGTLQSAESFRKAHDHGEEPRVGRRGNNTQMGTFGDVGGVAPPGVTSKPGGRFGSDGGATGGTSDVPAGLGSHFLCGQIPALAFPTGAAAAAAANAAATGSLLRAKVMTNAACVQKIGPVASRAAGTARTGMADFVVTAAEVYRQECKSDGSDHRGGDEDFFVDGSRGLNHRDGGGGGSRGSSGGSNSNHFHVENHSLMESSLQSSEQRDNRNEVSSLPPPEEVGLGRSSSSRSPDPKRSAAGGGRSPHTVSTADVTPPPPVDRVLDARAFPHSLYSQSVGPDDAAVATAAAAAGVPKEVTTQRRQADGVDDEDDDDSDALRDVRMDLFRSQVSGINEPEAKLARALDDLERQDGFIRSLKRQIEMTQKSLDETAHELEHVKAAAKERQFKSTEIRAKAVQEKKRLEDLYEKEVQNSKKLQESVSQLHFEMSTLEVSLRNVRSAKTGDVRAAAAVVPPPNADTYGNSSSSHNAQVISLKAEIVDLRSQLAEVKAANIEDSSTLHTMAEADELRGRLQRAEAELKDLRHRNRQALEGREQAEQTEHELRTRLDAVQAASQDAQARLEGNLVIAMKSADDVRVELVRTKANLQRLERERSRARLNSSADVERLSRDLAAARQESVKLERELSKARSQAQEDRVALMKEMDELREKLQSTNQQTLSMSSERLREQRRLHNEVGKSATETNALKETLAARNADLEATSVQIADLKTELARMTQRLEESDNHRIETVALLQQDLQSSKSKEQSLTIDLKLHKALLDEGRSNAKSSGVQLFLSSLNDGYIDHLKKTLENLRGPYDAMEHREGRSAESDREIDETLKNEIGLLKMRLGDSTSRSVGNPADSSMEVRLGAMEQAFLNEIAVLKAKLAESQSRIRDETYRAQEERRTNREGEADRLADLERLRQEKDEALKANGRLESEVFDLRQKLSNLPLTDDVPALVSETPTAARNADAMEVPNNVKRLRNELAQARERLAAARGSSRASPTPESGGKNIRTREVVAEPTSVSPDSVSTDKESSFTQSLGSNWSPSSDLMNAAHSLNSRTPLPARSPRSSKKVSLHELTRQLEASRKRLQTADQRLNGLVNDGALLTIVIQNADDATYDGSIDEVVNTLDGSIEVNHRRFADI